MPSFIYSEIDQTLAHNFLYDLNDINQSILNLLSTKKNTRIFLAAYGTDIESILFELDDQIATDLMFKTIIDAVSFWEPRVVLNPGASTVRRNPAEHTFFVNLVYNVKGLNYTEFDFTFGISP